MNFDDGVTYEDINEFTIDRINKSEILHVIGAPSQGKTFLIAFLLYALKHLYAVAVCFCGTEDTQGAFTPILGGAFVSSSFNMQQHKKHMSRQVLCKKEKCPQYHMISVVDDFGYDKKVSKAETIVESHKNGSQWLYELQIYGYQSVNDIPDEIYNAASKVFIFMEKEDSNRRKLHRKYFKTLIPVYIDFCRLMDDICQKHVCMVVDLKQQSSKLEDCVTYFKAPCWQWKHSDDPQKMRPHPEGWRFGCNQYKEWSDQRWDKNAIPDFVKELSGAFQ